MAQKLYYNRELQQVVDLLRHLTDEQRAEVTRSLFPEPEAPICRTCGQHQEQCSNNHSTPA